MKFSGLSYCFSTLNSFSFPPYGSMLKCFFLFFYFKDAFIMLSFNAPTLLIFSFPPSVNIYFHASCLLIIINAMFLSFLFLFYSMCTRYILTSHCPLYFTLLASLDQICIVFYPFFKCLSVRFLLKSCIKALL